MPRKSPPEPTLTQCRQLGGGGELCAAPRAQSTLAQSDGLSVLLHRPPSPYAGAPLGGDLSRRAGVAPCAAHNSQGVSPRVDKTRRSLLGQQPPKERKKLMSVTFQRRPVVPVRRRNPLSSSDRISESARPPVRSSALARTRKESRNPSVNLDCSVRSGHGPRHYIGVQTRSTSSSVTT